MIINTNPTTPSGINSTSITNLRDCAKSIDGNYFAIITTTALEIYKKNGTGYTKLASPSNESFLSRSGYFHYTGLCFSKDNQWLIAKVTGNTSDLLSQIIVYKNINDVFTKITQTNIDPPMDTTEWATDQLLFNISETGTYVAVRTRYRYTSSGNEYTVIKLYKNNDGVLTTVWGIENLNGGLITSTTSMDFDGNKLYIGYNWWGKSYIDIYSITENTNNTTISLIPHTMFTELHNISFNSINIQFNYDRTFLYVNDATYFDRLIIYKKNIDDTFTAINVPSFTFPPGVNTSLVYSPKFLEIFPLNSNYFATIINTSLSSSFSSKKVYFILYRIEHTKIVIYNTIDLFSYTSQEAPLTIALSLLGNNIFMKLRYQNDALTADVYNNKVFAITGQPPEIPPWVPTYSIRTGNFTLADQDLVIDINLL